MSAVRRDGGGTRGRDCQPAARAAHAPLAFAQLCALPPRVYAHKTIDLVFAGMFQVAVQNYSFIVPTDSRAILRGSRRDYGGPSQVIARASPPAVPD